jgi:hypothetical protein
VLVVKLTSVNCSEASTRSWHYTLSDWNSLTGLNPSASEPYLGVAIPSVHFGKGESIFSEVEFIIVFNVKKNLHPDTTLSAIYQKRNNA